MNLIDGKKISERILQQLSEEVKKLACQPKLSVLLVGDDPASQIYVNLKEAAARRANIDFRKQVFQNDVTKQSILECIQTWNADPKVHGILLQVPLPEGLRQDTDELIEAIDPQKDVDGFHRVNTERFLAGDESGVYPVFPGAMVELLLMAHQPLTGKHAVIVCNSMRFGEMMREALRRENLRAEIVLQEALLVNVSEAMRQASLVQVKGADIIVTACGVPNLITGDMVKAGAIIIDGGITKLPDGKIVGDVDHASMENIQGWLSPVPGGVGPVTVACLLRNVVELAKKQKTEA
jgi:methylenetetrahydrofolate dehydrogenase (NADP+)/methenyltetrahydrofolate cyclohydrolase